MTYFLTGCKYMVLGAIDIFFKKLLKPSGHMIDVSEVCWDVLLYTKCTKTNNLLMQSTVLFVIICTLMYDKFPVLYVCVQKLKKSVGFKKKLPVFMN